MTDSRELSARWRAPLVIGLGVTAQAVSSALRSRGRPVTVIDDGPTDASRATAAALGVTYVEQPDALGALVAAASVLVPSPGVPDRHPAFAFARDSGVPVASEFDLAGEIDDRPVAAITGTNGKTTVTLLTESMLNASACPAVAAGNTEVPLVAAIEADPEHVAARVFVVEASSFRLGHSQGFAPDVGTWLNFAPDHLDVHESLAAYESAKARIWQDPSTTAIAVIDDPVVARHAPRGAIRVGAHGDYRLEGDVLLGPDGTLAERNELSRRLPHDISNALAAAATARAVGASLDGIHAALVAGVALPHRVEYVGCFDGVSYYDDSKATAPHATAAALAGFDNVILIAGGRNKGIDLAPLADNLEGIVGVVAIGESAPDIVEVFAGRRPLKVAASMAEAVDAARSMAGEGTTVLLSPGCASFDWYRSYSERGDDFARCVRLLEETS